MKLKDFSILLEGGNAMQAARISVNDIKSTFDRYKQNVIKKIDPNAKYKTVGSLGKKPSSGDIDVAISSEIDLQTFSNKLTELGVDHKVNKGFNQIYTEYPIYRSDGQETGDKVQIDLMFGDVDFLSSSYWAPGEKQSKYTGAQQGIFFFGLTRFTPVKSIKNKENKIEFEQLKQEHPEADLAYVYDMNKGIFLKTRWQEETKSGKNKGKMKEVSTRLQKPEATSVEDILKIWNTDSSIEWTKQDFSLPLEKLWKKAKKSFSTDKLRNIMDYVNPNLEGKPQLESKLLNTLFMELMNESLEKNS